MTFAVHTFETNPDTSGNHSFSFHETLGEGQEIYFLAHMDATSQDPKKGAELIFGTLIEHFEQSSLKDPYDRFEEALRTTNFEAKKNKDSIGKTPHILIAYFDFHNLYLTQCGNSEAYLIRGNKVSQISEIPDAEDDLFVNILNGQVAIDDTILLSSDRLLRTLTTSQLTDIFTRSDFSDSCSVLRHDLATAADNDIVVTAIGVGKKDATQGAGFLSKVVSKGKEALATPPKTTKKETSEDVPTTPDQAVEEQWDNEETPSSLPSFKLPTWLSNLKQYKPEKNLLIIAGSVLGVLIIGLGLRFLFGYKSEEVMVLEEKIAIARTAIQQANSFVLQGEKVSANQHLDTAKESLQVVLNSENKDLRSQAQFTLAQVQELQDQIENVSKVNPEVLANIGAKNNDIKAQGLLDIRGNLYAFDNKTLHKTVRNIVEKGVAITDKETVLAGAARPDQNTLVFLTDGPRLIEYKDGILTPMATEDSAWKRGIDIKNFSSRYTYILDPAENQIWKYTRQRSSYSSGSPYNNTADLSQAVSFAIDGSIFILSEDGTIQRLFRGEQQDYEFKNLPDLPLRGKNIKVFTRQELDFLYVLDPNNNRILIFDKGERFATYKRQIKYNLGGDKAVDFSVDSAGQKVNLLTETKIYEISL